MTKAGIKQATMLSVDYVNRPETFKRDSPLGNNIYHIWDFCM